MMKGPWQYDQSPTALLTYWETGEVKSVRLFPTEAAAQVWAMEALEDEVWDTKQVTS